MKKSLAITIIMILIIGMFGGVVNAASASISASSKTVTVDDTVKITVSFGEKVKMAEFQLNYDKAKFDFVSCSKGSFGNKFSFVDMGAQAETSSITFTFKAKAAGTGTFSIPGDLKLATATEKPKIKCGSTASVTVKEKPQDPNPGGNLGGSTGGNNGNTGGSSNTGNTSNKNNNKNNNKNDKNKNEVKQEEPIDNTITEEPVVDNTPAPNELIKLDAQDVKTLEDEATKVMVKGLPVAIEENVELKVKLINEAEENHKTLEDIFKDVEGNKKYYDIQLLKDNVAVQPNGYVTVYIPIPEGFDKERIELYYVDEEDGTYELKSGEIQGDYYTFTTNHFSVYVLLERPEPKTFGQMVVEFFNNVTVLYVIIGVLTFIIIIETCVIVKLKRKQARRSK